MYNDITSLDENNTNNIRNNSQLQQPIEYRMKKFDIKKDRKNEESAGKFKINGIIPGIIIIVVIICLATFLYSSNIQVSDLQNQLNSSNQNIVNLQTDNNALNNALIIKDSSITSLQQQVQIKENEKVQLNLAISSRDSQITQLNLQNLFLDTNISNLKIDLNKSVFDYNNLLLQKQQMDTNYISVKNIGITLKNRFDVCYWGSRCIYDINGCISKYNILSIDVNSKITALQSSCYSITQSDINSFNIFQ